MTDPTKPVQKPRCPICGQVDKHADRCPGREPDKLGPDLQPLEDKPVKLGDKRDDLSWAQDIADEVPEPQQFGWQPTIPIQDERNGLILGPNGQPFGMKSQVVTEQSGEEQLFEKKRLREACWTCHWWEKDGGPVGEEKAQLFEFLAREAGWTDEGLKIVLEQPDRYGWCEAHQQLAHRDASCLRLYRPRRSWLRAFGNSLFGGSKKYGF